MPPAGFEPKIPASERPQTQDLEPNFNNHCTASTPNPVAAPSKAWVCEISFAGIGGLNPAGAMECCVLSGRDLSVGMITRPEESYRLWCV
jgi:hypothetical protein